MRATQLCCCLVMEVFSNLLSAVEMGVDQTGTGILSFKNAIDPAENRFKNMQKSSDI